MATNTVATIDNLLARGLAAAEAREFSAAEELYRDAMTLAPDDPNPKMLLGAMLAESGRNEEAVEVLEAGVALAGPLTPETFGIYNNLANALRRAERLDGAELLLREMTARMPNEWQPWHNLAQMLRDAQRVPEAVAAVRRAIALAPDFGPNHALLGAMLHEEGRLRSAEAAFERALAVGYDADYSLWTLYGNNHKCLGRRDEARSALERALALVPEVASANNNIGLIDLLCGTFDDAIARIGRAIEIEPDNDVWRANLGYVELTAGRIAEGWLNWEYAVKNGSRGSERPLGVPRWTPDRTAERALCYREQGVGDEILFASCYPDFIAAVGEAVIETDPRVASLFARSFPDAEVRPQSWTPERGETMHDFDSAIPSGSLPVHFRAKLSNFPAARRSYLVADPDRVDKWRHRLDEVAGRDLIVGMSWRSKIKNAERRLEYTRLDEDWAPLFAVPGVTWLNLQYDDCERDLRDAERRYGVTIHRWDDIDYLNDFKEVAAITTLCDLIVAPRNAVAMLSGALGVPTVMMGNRWDWSDLGTDTSPWFPSVQLVYRHFGEEWEGVIAAAADRVASAAQEGLGD